MDYEIREIGKYSKIIENKYNKSIHFEVKVGWILYNEKTKRMIVTLRYPFDIERNDSNIRVVKK